jgi:hypothetical protein
LIVIGLLFFIIFSHSTNYYKIEGGADVYKGCREGKKRGALWEGGMGLGKVGNGGAGEKQGVDKSLISDCGCK